MWVIISTYKEIEKSCSWDTKIIGLVSIWPPSNIFRELQMEPRVHVFNFRPAKNEVLFTFYILCIFYCHYFQIQMKYVWYRSSLFIIHQEPVRHCFTMSVPVRATPPDPPLSFRVPM